MASWFLRGLRRGVVTTRYPAREEPSTRLLPTPPVFRSDLLTEALVRDLVTACPSGALAHHGDVMRYDVGSCTTCGRCLRVAGAAARPSGTVELAATARDQLIKHVQIGGEPGG